MKSDEPSRMALMAPASERLISYLTMAQFSMTHLP